MKLETERLRLREFRPDDWPRFLRYHSNPLYLRYYAWESRDAESVREFITMLEHLQYEVPKTKFQFVTTLKATGELIGNCGIRKPHAEWHDAKIGYEFDPHFWGEGYGTEAARELVRYGFEVRGVDRIEADIVADNLGSAGVLRNAGLSLEGTLRKKLYYKGRHWDQQWFGILREEWEASRQ